jgi:hypothetical protein
VPKIPIVDGMMLRSAMKEQIPANSAVLPVLKVPEGTTAKLAYVCEITGSLYIAVDREALIKCPSGGWVVGRFVWATTHRFGHVRARTCRIVRGPRFVSPCSWAVSFGRTEVSFWFHARWPSGRRAAQPTRADRTPNAEKRIDLAKLSGIKGAKPVICPDNGAACPGNSAVAITFKFDSNLTAFEKVAPNWRANIATAADVPIDKVGVFLGGRREAFDR